MRLGLKCLIATVLISYLSAINVNADVNNYLKVTNSVVVDKASSDGDTILLPKEIIENDYVVENKTGSITIQLEDIEAPNDKSNVKFLMTKVADIIDGKYELNSAYSFWEVDLNNIKNSNELESAANKLANIVSVGDTLVTDSNGKIEVKDLSVGVYLIKAIDTENYDNITPFLISIPVWDESTKNMAYDVNILPKHSKPPKINNPDVPDTNYNSNSVKYMALGGCFLLIAALTTFTSKKRNLTNEG